VAFFEHEQLGDDGGSVSVVDLKGAKRILSSHWSSLSGLGWSRSGQEIWFTGSNTGLNRGLYAVDLSGRLRTVLRVPGSLRLFDVSRDGRVLLAEQNLRSEIWGLTPDSPHERDFTWLDFSAARYLSADGRWLLFDEQGDGGGPNYSLYLRKTDGSPAIRLGDNSGTSLSSDAKWAVSVTPGGTRPVVLVPTGAGEPRVIKSGNLSIPSAVFLPPDDRRLLMFTQEPRTYVQSIDGNTPRPVTPVGVSAWWFTADGKFMLGFDAEEKYALYPIDDGQPIPLPHWTAGDVPINHTNDNHSFFVRHDDLPANVYRYDFLTGSRQFVRQVQPADTTGIERVVDVFMTPDGKCYVYDVWRELGTLFVVTGLQ
jgi:hypothetical protein